MTRFIVALSFITLITACGGNSKPQIPAWYTQVYASQAIIYGKGVGFNLDDAVNAALTDVASQINVSVNSKTTTQQNKVNANAQSEYVNDTELSVQDFSFNGYKVEQTLQQGDKFFALISVDKQQLAQSKINELNALNSKIDTTYNGLHGASAIKTIQSAKAFEKLIAKARVTVQIISSLSPDFNSLQWHQYYDQYLSNITAKKQSIGFYIAPTHYPEIGLALSRKVNQADMHVLASQGQANNDSLFISFAINKEDKKLWDNYMTKLNVHLIAKDVAGNTVASKRFELSATSLKNYQLSEKAASLQFAKKIEKMALFEILGLL